MFRTVLPGNAQDALALLGRGNVFPPKTYLAGGTGLALQFGHRISVDFDFFTPENFNQKILTSNLASLGKFKTSREAPDTLLGTFQNTSFSIFTYRYPLIGVGVDFLGIKLASPKDIAAMKIEAVMTRGSKKDFTDLYFLDKNKIPLDESLRFYEEKYHTLESNLYSIILSLRTFDHAEQSEMPPMVKKVNWKDIKTFFLRESLRLAKKHL